MAELEILTQFSELIEQVFESLKVYNDNLRNEMFEIEPNEDNQQAYKRGETLFDRCEDDLNNLNDLLNKKNQVLEFFEKCQENKQKLINQKNSIINKLLRIKKETVTKDEWLDYREFWNKKREETPDEKNRRECEEMLEEIKEEKQIVQEMTKNMIKVKEEVEEVIKNGKVDEFVKRDEYSALVENYNVLVNQYNEMFSNYVKKDGILETIEKEKILKQSNLTSDQMKQLEEWTRLKCKQIVFDSNIDNWSKNTSVFNERIIGKKQLVFLIESEDGEKFGYYLNTEVIERYNWQRPETDNRSFEFNLQSNGRLPQPMKFEIKNLEYGGYYLWENSAYELISMGEIKLFKENWKNYSYCCQYEDGFDYHGIQNALCGKRHIPIPIPIPYSPGAPPNQRGIQNPFSIKRLLVIQMN